MGWMENLYNTYERCKHMSHVPPLSPICHSTQKAQIEITIDGQGNFCAAKVVEKKEATTVIPCTESSGGRTSGVASHPLCDKLQYIAADFLSFGGELSVGKRKNKKETRNDLSKDPHQEYLTLLSGWKDFSQHPKLEAILNYVKKGRVVEDLVQVGILPIEGEDTSQRLDGKKIRRKWPKSEKDNLPKICAVLQNKAKADSAFLEYNTDEAFVRWKVEIHGSACSATWEDFSLFDSWIAYYSLQQKERGFCMITGESGVLMAERHPAKIRNAGDQAKIISSNDKIGFTFRGRFTTPRETCGVSFEVSQKAHLALQWLVERQAYRNGDQAFVAWEIGGKEIPDPLANTFVLFGLEEDDQEKKPSYEGDVGQAFGVRLSKFIAGHSTKLGATDRIVIMGLDSASKGRLAITYYRELTGTEFLARLQSWHDGCAWYQNYGKDQKNKNYIQFVGSPSPRDIAIAAYGSDKQYKKIVKAAVERLLPCIAEGVPLPRDIVDSVVGRASNRIALESWEWERNLGIACSLVKNFFRERSYKMTLETERKTRDYLYGRLLAIADNIEDYALTKAEKNRSTTAVRYMQIFSARPFSAWRNIELALAPYMARLNASEANRGFLISRRKLMDEVISDLGEQFLDDKKLSGEFLLGYHCQRRKLFAGEEKEKNALPISQG